MNLTPFEKAALALVALVAIAAAAFVVRFSARMDALDAAVEEMTRQTDEYLTRLETDRKREAERPKEAAAAETPKAKPEAKDKPQSGKSAPPVRCVTRADPRTVAVVSQTLWREARGEGNRGIKAVASVIVNRARERGTDAATECLRRKQFSCWNRRRPKLGETHEGAAWNDCVAVANRVASDSFKPTISATHYYAHGKCRPKWAAELKGKQRIGNHTFGEMK